MTSAEFEQVATRRSPTGVKAAQRLVLSTLSWAPLRLRIKFGRTNHLFLKTLSGT